MDNASNTQVAPPASDQLDSCKLAVDLDQEQALPRDARGFVIPVPKPEGYVDKPAGFEVDGRPRCAAWGRQRGSVCLNAPGQRTTHPGEGRCWLHGGKTLVKTGRYSLVAHARMQTHLREIVLEGNQLDVEPELIMLRALLRRFIEENAETLDTGTLADLDKVNVVRNMIDQIGKTVGRIERARALTSLSKDELKELVAQMAAVVERVVEDQDKLRQISREWNLLIVGRSASGAEQARGIYAVGEEEGDSVAQ